MLCGRLKKLGKTAKIRIIFVIIILAITVFIYFYIRPPLFQYSYEMLSDGLVSIEVIEFDLPKSEANRNYHYVDYQVLGVIQSEEEANDIVRQISQIEFRKARGKRMTLFYGLMLNYQDRHIIFTGYTFYFANEEYILKRSVSVHDDGEGLELLDKYVGDIVDVYSCENLT